MAPEATIRRPLRSYSGRARIAAVRPPTPISPPSAFGPCFSASPWSYPRVAGQDETTPGHGAESRIGCPLTVQGQGQG